MRDMAYLIQYALKCWWISDLWNIKLFVVKLQVENIRHIMYITSSITDQMISTTQCSYGHFTSVKQSIAHIFNNGTFIHVTHL